MSFSMSRSCKYLEIFPKRNVMQDKEYTQINAIFARFFRVDKTEKSAYTNSRNSNVSGVRAPKKVVLEVGQGKHPHRMTS